MLELVPLIDRATVFSGFFIHSYQYIRPPFGTYVPLLTKFSGGIGGIGGLETCVPFTFLLMSSFSIDFISVRSSL